MLRSVLLAVALAVLMSTTAAMADDKSDCQKGVAMIRTELKKKHPERVLVILRKALSDAELEEAEEDWADCMKYIKSARASLSR
jgi:3-methyladenine DNA glycosylase AlkC